jgi:D-alanyl-D-alanine carboxypeptidase (penicillin-binding protein 5/6)
MRTPSRLRALVAGPIVALLAASALIIGAPAATAEPIGGPQLSGYDVVVDPGPKADPLPDIQASAWILADLDTGEVLAAKAPHVQRAPASILKTLTLLTLVQRLSPDQVYTTTYDDLAIEGSRVGIVEDAPYTIRELMLGLMMQSGNDTAHALAMANGGMKKTLADMNAEAQRLQAYDTVAKTPHGLPAEGQVTSAYDMALIAREGLKRPDFFEYVNTKQFEMPGYMPDSPDGKRQTFTIATQNPLFIVGYEGAIGVKTGWTTEAGRTYVGAARRGDTSLVIVLLNVITPIADGAIPLLDWGFANRESVTPVGLLVDPVTVAAEPGGSGDPTGYASASADASAPPSDTGSTPVSASVTSSVDTGWMGGIAAAFALGIALLAAGIWQWRRPVPDRGRHRAHRPTSHGEGE